MNATARCPRCNGGEFQDLRGQTACNACPRGRFCPEGSLDPQLCTGGTTSNVTGVAFRWSHVQQLFRDALQRLQNALEAEQPLPPAELLAQLLTAYAEKPSCE